MVGISGPREVGLVAGVASRGSVDIVIVGVALHAGKRGMPSGQRVVRIQGVIEFRIQPVDCRVTRGAIVRQTQLHVRWVLTADKIRRVAGVAIRRRPLVHVVNVARGTRESYVRTGERIASEL